MSVSQLNFSVRSEDSSFVKVLAAVPLIGMIPRLVVHSALNDKYVQTGNPGQQIQVVKIKNAYHVSEIISRFLAVAALIGALVSGVLRGPIALIFSGLLVAGTLLMNCLSYSDIRHNNGVIREIRRKGSADLEIR